MLYRKETALILLALLAGGACYASTVLGEQGTSDSSPTATKTERAPDARMAGRLGISSGNFLWLLEHEGVLSVNYQRMKDQLLNSRVPTREKAEGIVIKAMSEVSGRGNLTLYRVIDLVTIGVDVPGFASHRDMIWIVRISDMELVKQEAWVSSSTGSIRWILPFPAENPKPDMPSGAMP